MQNCIKEDNVVNRLPYGENVKLRLKKLIQIILNSGLDCKEIILFGSYARFEQTIQSDLDILLLTSCEVDQVQRGYLASVFEENKADLIFCTLEQFMSSNCLLYENIRKDGIMLWKA